MVSLSYLVHVLSSLELLGAILTKVRDGRFTAPPPSFDNHNPLTRSAPSALARKKALQRWQTQKRESNGELFTDKANMFSVPQ